MAILDLRTSHKMEVHTFYEIWVPPSWCSQDVVKLKVVAAGKNRQ